MTTVRSAAAAVVDAQRRFRRRRRAGRWRHLRRAGVVVGIGGALVAGGWVVAHSSLLDVRTVTVEGTSRLAVSEVLAAAHVAGGSPVLTLDSGAIEQRVEQLPAVAHADVHRDWPHGVVIAIEERTPVAVVTGGGTPMLVDRTGVAFAPAPADPPELVTVQVRAPVPGAGEPATRAAMQVLTALPPRVRERVASLSAPSLADVSFELRDGRTVVWGSTADSRSKAAVLRSLLHRHAEEYDVSTPGVVVTR